MKNPRPGSGHRKRSTRTDNQAIAYLWAEFEARFPTEESCIEELYRIAECNGILKCRECGSLDIRKENDRRVIKCNQCRKSTWFTVGTLFERARLIRVWIAAIWLMERGILLTSTKLHQLSGATQSSSLKILNKVRTVIQVHMQEGSFIVPSTIFRAAFIKRSRVTPATLHPSAEQDDMENLQDDEKTDEDNRNNRKSGSAQSAECQQSALAQYTNQNLPLLGLEKTVYELLSSEPVDVDSLCQRAESSPGQIGSALIMLELSQAVERLPGGKYIRFVPKTRDKQKAQSADCSLSDAAAALTAEFLDLVEDVFIGISRKYLQKYLAAYKCYRDRTKWNSESLFAACLRHKPISYKEILAYVTPLLVTM